MKYVNSLLKIRQLARKMTDVMEKKVTESNSTILTKAIEPKNETETETPAVSANEKRKAESDAKKEYLKKLRREPRTVRPGYNEDKYDETTYYFQNGLRKVYPYYFTFTTFCKGRWIGRTIYDIFSNEFRSRPKEEYGRLIENGSIMVNLNKIAPDYVLQNGDFINHKVHRHEVPVTSEAITFVHNDDDIVVINKPCSIPIHPCGRYRQNSVIFILAKDFNLRELRTVHRIDRLTSGILILAKNSKIANVFEQKIKSHQVQKEYLCRVDGEFPKEPVTCDEPIAVISHKIGLCAIGADGKPCSTEFTRFSYNGKTSVVLCKPKTGRMHQIRVHLQYLGFPISNDPVYNHSVFGPTKGKGGFPALQREELINNLISCNNMESWLSFDNQVAEVSNHLEQSETEEKLSSSNSNKNDINSEDSLERLTKVVTPDDNNLKSVPGKDDDVPEHLKFVPEKMTVDSDCYECLNRFKFRDPTPDELIMYLHAWKYKGDDFEYTTEMPFWAKEDWPS